MYINQKLYPLVRAHLNINPNNINIIDVNGDGNCLFRSIARFVYGTEELYPRVRQEIYQEARRREDNYPDITLDTESGPLNIHQYINEMKNDRFYGGELEISIANTLYGINIATYNEIYDNNNNIIGFTPINYYNQDNIESRHL